MKRLVCAWIGGFCLLFLSVACSRKEADYTIAVSQCSEDDWRAQMNKEILREALFYPGVNIEVYQAHDDNVRQIQDIESLIKKKVDLLIVAPNEAEAITPVIEKVYDAGIPVILVDRKINSEKYTAYVGADNYEIGRRAGEYIADRLKGKGRVIEIAGLKGSTPAVERHRGMVEALKAAPDVQVIASVEAGWFQQKAGEVMDSLLDVYPQVDLVFAQNDRMAIGAYEKARQKKRAGQIAFVGVDAVTDGVESVAGGRLDATFIYPTGGDKVMQVAMAILRGEPYQRENILSTALVNRANARVMQMQMKHILTLDQKIELLNRQLDDYFLRYSAQKMFLYACVVILVLAGFLFFFLVRAFWVKNRLNTELSSQKQQLEQQRDQLQAQRDQLIVLSRQLEEATHAKLAFFTSVSHDFRTPLTLIADPINQLLEEKHLGERERNMLEIVRKNVAVLLRLITQILDFQKYEHGKLALRLSEFNALECIKDWTEAFHTLAFRKHIQFEVKAEGDVAQYVMVADAEKIERITYNLLSNAFKFTPEKGEIKVVLSRIEQNNQACICMEVRDTGIGMSEEHIHHVFEHFYQIDVQHTGSGLGLALVEAFVNLHRGTVQVESGKGKGTCFRVILPMKQEGEVKGLTEKNEALEILQEGAVLDAGQETLHQWTENTGVEESADKEMVLVIDDNQDVRDYVKMLLQDKYVVVEAVNGLEGVKQAMKYVPDVVVCDVMMPVMDGIACCKRLKSELQTSHIPVLMLTAYAMDEQRIQGYDSGADAYLTKPFNAKLLMTRIRNLIDNRKRLKSLAEDVTGGGKQSLGEVDKGFVEKLKTLIDEKMGDSELSVEDLGAELGLGRVQLYRKTKSLTGYAPNELLRIARLRKAASLLASSEKTVAEITYEVGFSSPSYFTKCYKDYFGESPSEFLKRRDGKN
ncbi:hybrid sensor histidine kinase/response regulator transcription factor [Phocaeicola plebeius]|uniref:hybrid sensor histidine kinase/response regulator transcription factor n=1 Tax=Phocaeicola plebeius TaxID=310297 RepID=UPI0026EEDA59|nr:substrate-binding domain-containing protein [Phocaeicola plebeius]